MWLFLTEMLLASALVVWACRTRRSWSGALLLLVLCIGFYEIVGFYEIERTCAQTDDRALMYLVPFVFGLPAIVIARGRALAKALSPAERERRANEAAKIYGPCPVGAFIFGILSLLVILTMASSWTVVDLNGARVRVERRTWWGLRVREQAFPQGEVVTVEVAERVHRSLRGAKIRLTALVFRRSDGMVLGTTGGGSWGLFARDDADALEAEFRKGAEGRFRKCSFVLVGPYGPLLFAFLLMTLLLGRGMVRSRKPDSPALIHSPRGGVSLASVVLKRPRR